MNKKILFPAIVTAFLLMGCKAQQGKQAGTGIPVFDWQAHRGGRGLMPENTIAAMKKAIDLNAMTVELDVLITADKQVLVSHDMFLNPVITTTPAGHYLTKAEAMARPLYTITYDSIALYDVGMKPHPDFPRQQKLAANMPLLTTLIDSCEAYAAARKKQLRYNIELKSNKNSDGVRHPAPEVFVDMVMAIVQQKNIGNRYMVQSFDARPLQYLHKQYPAVTLAFLVDKNAEKLEQQLGILGFVPPIYAPQYTHVSKQLVQECHAKNIRVIPWTVNSGEAIEKLVADGVDGIISDYPNLFPDTGIDWR